MVYTDRTNICFANAVYFKLSFCLISLAAACPGGNAGAIAGAVIATVIVLAMIIVFIIIYLMW